MPPHKGLPSTRVYSLLYKDKEPSLRSIPLLGFGPPDHKIVFQTPCIEILNLPERASNFLDLSAFNSVPHDHQLAPFGHKLPLLFISEHESSDILVK